MTCCQTSKPVFKGVVVTTATLLSIVAATGAIGVDISTISDCKYLAGSQELDCVCPTNASADGAPSAWPSGLWPWKAVPANATVASFKIHSCASISVALDLTSLPSPAAEFRRLRFEDVVGDAQLLGVAGLQPGSLVDVQFRNVGGKVAFSGAASCEECKTETSSAAPSVMEPSPAAEVTLHANEAKNVELSGAVASEGVDFALKVRNTDSLEIDNCHFR